GHGLSQGRGRGLPAAGVAARRLLLVALLGALAALDLVDARGEAGSIRVDGARRCEDLIADAQDHALHVDGAVEPEREAERLLAALRVVLGEDVVDREIIGIPSRKPRDGPALSIGLGQGAPMDGERRDHDLLRARATAPGRSARAPTAAGR